MEITNDKELKKKRDKLKEDLRNKKNELKEKQGLLRRQEKQMKEQHEAYITLEEKCRKLESSINIKKAGLSSNPTEAITENDIQSLEEEIKSLEQAQNEEKRKYKQMISTQENKLKELTSQVDALTFQLKQKDQECRMNALKINELKRHIRTGAGKLNLDKCDQDIYKYTKNVEEIKRDMEAEKEGLNSASTPVDASINEIVKEIDIDKPQLDNYDDIEDKTEEAKPQELEDNILQQPDIENNKPKEVPKYVINYYYIAFSLNLILESERGRTNNIIAQIN